ncbi:MAG: hypothetical protein ACK4WK_03925, partial [Anaerolineae bacterium]
MYRSRLFLPSALLLGLALLVTACAPATPQIVKETVVVTAPPPPPAVVTATPVPAPPPPFAGVTLTLIDNPEGQSDAMIQLQKMCEQQTGVTLNVEVV